MTAWMLYLMVATLAGLILLWDRWRVRGTLRLHREDYLTSLTGAVCWPFVALVYAAVHVNVWIVRALPSPLEPRPREARTLDPRPSLTTKLSS